MAMFQFPCGQLARRCATTAALLVLALASPAWGETWTVARFLAEYEPAARRLEGFYGNVRMSASTTRDGKLESRMVFRGNAGRARLDAIEEAEPRKGTLTVQVATEGLSFGASRKLTSDQFALDGIGSSYKESLAFIRSTAFFPTVPFGWFDESFIDMFKDPEWTMKPTKVDETREGNDRVVRLHTEGEKWSAWYAFLPDRAWALWGYSLWLKDMRPETIRARRSQEVARHVRVRYEGEHEGIPLLKQVDLWFEYGVQREAKYHDTMVIDELIPAPAPEEDFTLAAFGLRDPAEASRWVRVVFLAVNGAVLLAAGYHVARRLRARRA